jgi:transcription initiation factor TFIIIB Brf1 subunit/transcription initiation factor TFIIB
MTDECDHSYPVIDEHEGTTVCCDCGLVLEKEYYTQPVAKNDNVDYMCSGIKKNNNRIDALELLNRLNLPIELLNQVPLEKQNVENLYDIINKSSVVTTKEFCAASGIKNKKLVRCNQNKVMQTNITLLLDKYCNLLQLTFRDYTLIKDLMMKKPFSGHPPLTIIGYYIFTYCRSNKIKLSMKIICSTLGISTISIQRYSKYELSCRS